MSADLASGDRRPAGAAASEAAAGFKQLLFRRVPAEDLALCGPEILAVLARGALAHLAEPREAGTSSVRFTDHEIPGGAGTRHVTVLEAVNDDMPFLLDSTLAELVERGLEPRLVAHPILAVERGPDRSLARLLGEAATEPRGVARESLIHIHLDRLDEAERDRLRAGLDRVYADVRAAVSDGERMRSQLQALAAEYRQRPPALEPAEIDEAASFLEWLAAGNFILLGARAHRILEGEVASEALEGSGLGLLSDPAINVLKRRGELVAVTPELRAFLDRPRLLFITKASVKSRVHRRAYLDYVGAKLFSPSGRLWGEFALVGLFTATAYTSSIAGVPYLRRKAARILDRAGFDPASFDGRSLTQVLEVFPRDELFQIDEDTLFAFALDVLHLAEHPRIRALIRPDRFGRFVSAIVYVPKDRYDSDVRRRVGEYLAKSFDGRVSAAYPAYPEGPLARTHFIIGRDGDTVPDVPREEIERGIAEIVRTWSDKLAHALDSALPPARARELSARYAEAFGAAYRDAFEPAQAVTDIDTIERLSEARPRAVDLYRREGDPAERVNLKLFSRGASLPLSDRVPLLERLGFRVVNERTYRIAPAGSEPSSRIWLHDMALERATGAPIAIEEIEARVEAALLAIFRGVTESDGFNKLVLEAGLGWREAALMRAFGRYLRQVVIPYGQEYLASVLARHPAIVGQLLALFYARFDPHPAEGRPGEEEVSRELAGLLAEVASLEEDRILRRFLNLIEACVRTNFFRIGENGLPVETIAFKFEGARVEELPKPHPLYEIFMNSPRLEALHLRFGKVARGGIRWTDRPQDFRTEILGLVKAQQVKNAVIVPVGAKGGFFPKLLPPPGDRAAWMEEGTQAYRLFIRTLLDVTDDLEGDRVVPPPDVLRRDGDDPYLVVAADKGTATFSDTANAISLERGYWLGDAFASGGSQGYDHKRMGITARGAWEAVKRHFREIDIDIQAEPVTVVGVGDMSGDVFGNGMLLSRAIKLVAAFDHRDIFIDPDPDPARAWAERKRLFDLPRSSWADYNRALISAGGGVFSRSSKSIPLSPEARKVLGLDKADATPNEVMSAILSAPVGLLFFGGIGTYIRASDETDAAAGDRANDPIRIAGSAVRARVIGEGANLGMTQRGRIEAARHGVRLNTDAIDNSAGVNTSDVEVNIKIALAMPVRDGRLDGEARNALLTGMTDEVARLVLRNNYLQTLALSLAERRGIGDLGFLERLMSVLEGAGRLDRPLEFLPGTAEIEARRAQGAGLTRPELAVLIAYAKLALHDELLASAVPDDPYLGRELERYFPVPLRERFPDAVAGHRLRREIIATQLANAIVNRGGPSVVTRLADETGADAPTIAAAYAATRDTFGLLALNNAVDALDGRIPGALQLELYAAIQDLTLSRMVWFTRNVDFRQHRLDEVVGLYAAGIAEVAEVLDAALAPASREGWAARTARLVAGGVPDDLARRIAALQDLVAAPDIVLVANRTGRPVVEIARIHFAADGLFGLGELAGSAAAIPVTDHYDRLARDRAVDALAAAHRRLTAEIAARDGEAGPDRVRAWATTRGGEVERIRGAVQAIASSGLTVSKLTVAASLLADLAKE
ncbi:NAD-glutamate dehydrogenase [Enterovirga aerilata]|uniref:NAD-glutamate dehydrogenase n=1 Tax=Enterovirga aerilata TaxID=2730920 RepID=A0A849I8B6_9HYPH|nr:NAD-glutamate dehydrogenase [Enterovirga sp. DB1703]NNM73638.1 NAD-glutamate dehydrogenase [Enterovirga sp. DB1703]